MAYISTNQEAPVSPLWCKALLFAAGAGAIGFVVYPNEIGIDRGISTIVFVSGRLFWGALIVAGYVILSGSGPSLFKITRKGFLFACLRGLFVGLITILLYSYALSKADATPTIMTVVGVAALVGTLTGSGGRPRGKQLFVLLGTMGALYGALSAFHTGNQFGLDALMASAASGLLYGLLPWFCRSDEASEATTVAQYLICGFVFSLVPLIATSDVDAATVIGQFFTWPLFVAGGICTGLAYLCIQFAIAPTPSGDCLCSGWATILYGMEPVAAMLAAAVLMHEIIPFQAVFFIGLYLLLSLTAGSAFKSSS